MPARSSEAGENTVFLPGFPLPKEIAVTGDNATVSDAEIVLSVVPSEFLRSTFARLSPHLRAGQVIVSATKGMEDHSFLRMTEVIGACLAQGGHVKLPIGALSRSVFAWKWPRVCPPPSPWPSPTRRSRRTSSANSLRESLRLYTSTDVIGVELGGALKNVIAIAAGVAAGVGLGYNSAAALITRGIAEITRLAVACGGRRETLAGLSGVGDLVLTCTGSLSRNRTVGVELGRGRKLPEILDALDGKVAEGVLTCRAALGLARRHGIEMPITEQMELILEKARTRAKPSGT